MKMNAVRIGGRGDGWLREALFEYDNHGRGLKLYRWRSHTELVAPPVIEYLNRAVSLQENIFSLYTVS